MKSVTSRPWSNKKTSLLDHDEKKMLEIQYGVEFLFFSFPILSLVPGLLSVEFLLACQTGRLSYFLINI